MPESTKVWFNGSTATFRSNARNASKGFVYSGGRRVYGRIEANGLGTTFVPNHSENTAIAQPV